MIATAHPRLVHATLFAGAFTMGCAEMLVVGLVGLVAADLRVDLPAAGALVTANALGLALGGPLLTALTARLDRRTVLLAATALFLALNLVPAAGGAYEAVLAARGAIGALQGLFIAAAITTATSIVPRERAGRAMAVVISGFASASAFGLPAGTLLGQAVGWRGAFAVVVAVAGIVLVAAALLLPRVPAGDGPGAAGQARHAFAPPVLAVLALCALVFVAVQSTLTYVVPFLAEVTGVEGPLVGAYLLAYGVATTAGSAIGGRFADTGATRTLIVGSAGVAASLAALLLGGANPVVAAVAILGLGASAMGMAPSMQHRVATLAGPGAPLAAALPASAVNAGIAGGSAVGGAAIAAAGVPAAVPAGLLTAALGIAVAVATSFLRPAAAHSPHPVPAREEHA